MNAVLRHPAPHDHSILCASFSKEGLAGLDLVIGSSLPDIEILRVSSPAEARAGLQRGGGPSVVLAVQDQGPPEGIDFLAAVKELSPQSARLLWAPVINEVIVKGAVNRAEVFGILGPWQKVEEVRKIIDEAHAYHLRQMRDQSLFREIKIQNIHLEEMNENLERLVRERTQTVETSKSELENKVSRIRALIRYIQDLAGLVAVEELLLLLRQELKRHHKIGDPFLGYSAGHNLHRILHVRGQRVQEKRVRRPWPPSLRIRWNEREDRQYLADEFGRPFAKVLTIPLLTVRSRAGGEGLPAILFFEHSMDDFEVEEFIRHIGERLQPFSMALDRIVLESDMKNASYLWEHTFDGIEEPVAILDLEHNLLRSNSHFGAFRPGEKCHQAFVGGNVACKGCPVAGTLETGMPRSGRVRRGSELYEVRSYPIEFAQGTRPTTVVNHYVDITRSQELQSRMIQNEKMAAVGHLAGNIAHELNNPLTGIRSLAQVLLKELDPEQAMAGDLREVEKAAHRSQRIINNLLDFSRGGVGDKVRVEDLNAITERTLPLLKTAMGQFYHEIDLAEGPLWVKVEPQLIQQVIFNVINNACQAMEGLRGRIEVRTGREDGRAWVSVRDSGKGIAPENLESIFEPFFTTKAPGKGTGLGLSMSREIVREFGGDIVVWSETGAGTCFTIRLPIQEADDENLGGG